MGADKTRSIFNIMSDMQVHAEEAHETLINGRVIQQTASGRANVYLENVREKAVPGTTEHIWVSQETGEEVEPYYYDPPSPDTLRLINALEIMARALAAAQSVISSDLIRRGNKGDQDYMEGVRDQVRAALAAFWEPHE